MKGTDVLENANKFESAPRNSSVAIRRRIDKGIKVPYTKTTKISFNYV